MAGLGKLFFWHPWPGVSCHNCFASARVCGLCNDGDDDDGTCCQGHLVICGTLLAVRRYGIPPKLSVRRNGEGCSSVRRVIASLALVKSGCTRGLPHSWYPTSATPGSRVELWRATLVSFGLLRQVLCCPQGGCHSGESCKQSQLGWLLHY